MAVLGLRFCARAFASCSERGPLFIAVRGPLTIAASPVAEHKLETRRLSSCGSRAQSLHGMWDLPRPGLEPMSPALAGRFSTTAPPGKPYLLSFQFVFQFQYSRNTGIFNRYPSGKNFISQNAMLLGSPFCFSLTYAPYFQSYLVHRPPAPHPFTEVVSYVCKQSDVLLSQSTLLPGIPQLPTYFFYL